MVDDPNRKSVQSFQCRDVLWDALDSLSQENEQSVDYLLNEAIRAYLQAHGRSVFAPRASAAVNPPQMPAMPAMPAMPQRTPSMAPPARTPPLPPMAGRPPAVPSMPPPSARIPSLPGAGGGPPPMPRPSSGAMPPAFPPMGGPPQRMPPPMPAREKQLFAVYEGQEYVVDKEEFFIGRGQKVCDVVIRDSNVSRQHAKVIKHGGAWWVLDNQSLNGVEFRGAKLQQKKIDDGDVFTVCGYPIQFNFR